MFGAVQSAAHLKGSLYSKFLMNWSTDWLFEGEQHWCICVWVCGCACSRSTLFGEGLSDRKQLTGGYGSLTVFPSGLFYGINEVMN